MSRLYQDEEIGWDRLDKKKFFVYGMGMFSGVTTLLFPLSVIKTRQMAIEGISGGWGGVKQTVGMVWRQDGLLGFYKGFGTVIFGTIPARVVYLGTLEAVKKAVQQGSESLKLSETTLATVSNSAAGAAASLATQSVTVPVDVVSSRLMVQGSELAGSNRAQPAPSTSAGPRSTGTAGTGHGMAGVNVASMQAASSQTPPSTRQLSTHARSHAAQQRLRLKPHAAAVPTQLDAPRTQHSHSSWTTSGRRLCSSSTAQEPIRNGFQMARLIVRQEGFAGLYRGFGASIATFVPSSAVWWGSYGGYQKLIWQALYHSRGQGAAGSVRPKHTAAEVLAVQTSASLLAGVTSAVATNPLDLIKVRLQVARRQEGQELSFRSVLRQLLQQDGVAGLMRGVMPRIASTSLWGTAMVSTYELLKRLCQIPAP